MFELKTFVPGRNRHPVSRQGRGGRQEQEPNQRRMMLAALTLLVVALGLVLYHDRDFWFPDTQEADNQPQPPEIAPSEISPRTQTVVARPASPVGKKSRPTNAQPNPSKIAHDSQVSASARDAITPDTAAPDSSSPDASAPGFSVTTTRTVLPPLEIEVVAGDIHRTVRPGSNSVRVDLQPGSHAPPVTDAPADSVADTAANMTSSAAERVQISADTTAMVSRSVTPGYPMLARQMKVQGSVILQALIGRDGFIQDLRVLSGPPILASAAQEAVKQWHFKPHYQGPDTVETQAKITVNFTISTN
jgi:TonB family protein